MLELSRGVDRASSGDTGRLCAQRPLCFLGPFEAKDIHRLGARVCRQWMDAGQRPGIDLALAEVMELRWMPGLITHCPDIDG